MKIARRNSFLKFSYRWVSQIIDPFVLLKSIPNYLHYLKDWIVYRRRKGSERLKLIETYPCIHDNTKNTPFEPHYFYQDIWAFKKIYSSEAKSHVDVGSNIKFVGLLTSVTKVTFIDIRPLKVMLHNLNSKKGSILSMPFKDKEVESLSCLHVAEHIGLGRYGDPIDPQGTKKACTELKRVLAPKGHLYFSLPVGRQRVCFNAHRVHSPKTILKYFDGLKLLEFSGIDDNGNFTKNADISEFEMCDFGCGLFHFVKE